MYTISGSTWQVLSTQDHATNILANWNALLAAQGLDTITATTANIGWLFCLAAGQEIAETVDQPLNAAKNSFDLSNCDDEQLYDVLPLAGTNLIPASYSSMYVNFRALPSGPLTVTSGSHITVSGLSSKFLTQSSITIPASGTGTVFTVCDTAGAVVVVSGQVNGIVESVGNLAYVTNYTACSVGRAVETATELRARLIAGNTISNNVDGLTTSLRSLAGITNANVYFNNTLASITLSGTSGDIVIPARTSYVVIQGGSSEIASTYWAHMLAPTYGTQSQDVTSLSNQTFTIHYDNAVSVPIYIKVYIQTNTISNSGYKAALYSALANITSKLGGIVTSDYVCDQLNDYYYATIQGVLLSLDNINYSVAVNLPANGYGAFPSANVTVVLQ